MKKMRFLLLLLPLFLIFFFLIFPSLLIPVWCFLLFLFFFVLFFLIFCLVLLFWFVIYLFFFNTVFFFCTGAQVNICTSQGVHCSSIETSPSYLTRPIWHQTDAQCCRCRCCWDYHRFTRWYHIGTRGAMRTRTRGFLRGITGIFFTLSISWPLRSKMYVCACGFSSAFFFLSFMRASCLIHRLYLCVWIGIVAFYFQTAYGENL